MEKTVATYAPVSGGGFLGFIFGSGPLDRVPGSGAWAAALVLAAARVWLAIPFVKAGLTRWADFTGGSWDTQLFLFGYEHPLPYVPAEVAAPFAMAGELTLPVLLVLGLFGRLGALGLTVMAATIFLLLPAPYSNGAEQIPWMAVGFMLFLAGPGRLSVDYLIRKRFSL